MKKSICVIILAVSLAACTTNSVVSDSRYSKTGQKPDFSKINVHMVFTLVPVKSTNVDMEDICPGGLGKVQTKFTFLNMLSNALLTGATFGLAYIIGPQFSNTKVWCVSGGGSEGVSITHESKSSQPSRQATPVTAEYQCPNAWGGYYIGDEWQYCPEKEQ